MDHATCFRLLSATHFATSLLPLTVRLIPVLTEIGRLIVGFRRAELTPQVCHQFETQLHAQLGCDRASAKDFHEIRAVFTRGVA